MPRAHEERRAKARRLATQTRGIIEEAAALGIDRVWMHRGAGPGSVSARAVAKCEDLGLSYVAGECPLMFLEDPGWVHRLHALGKRIAGTYPA